MIWSLLALTGAIAQAAYSTGVKMLLPKVSPFFLAGSSFLVASGVLFVFSSLVGFPVLSPGFLPAVAVTVAINILATILSYRALAISDLSLCLPMLAFTPVFLLLTSFLILGEVPTLPGIHGICLVAAGSYLMAVRKDPSCSSALLDPFFTLSRDAGVRMMLAVAFLYSISVNYDKVVVETAGPIFGSAVVLGLLGMSFLAGAGIGLLKGEGLVIHPGSSHGIGPLMGKERVFNPGTSRGIGLLLLALGLILALEAVSVNLAYTQSIVPYVISIKRLSIFFAVLFGGFFLSEGGIRQRAAGSLVMVAGTVLIALWG